MKIIYHFDDTGSYESHITRHNDFNMIETFFPDLLISMRCSIRPSNYNSDPLFVPPYIELNDEGLIEWDYFDSNYSWTISRNLSGNSIIFQVTCTYDEDYPSPSINGSKIEFVFPSCTGISCSVGVISGNKWTWTLDSNGCFSIPTNTKLQLTINSEAFIFNQWKNLNINKSYPKIYGFYKNGDDGNCYPYEGQQLKTLKNAASNTQWALVAEVCNLFCENNKNVLQTSEISIDSYESAISPHYDMDGWLVGSSLTTAEETVYASADDTDPEKEKYILRGRGYPNHKFSDSKWTISNTKYEHLGYLPIYTEWEWLGSQSLSAISNLPSLVGTNDSYLIVRVGSYTLTHDYSYKNAMNVVVTEYDHSPDGKTHVDATTSQLDRWLLSTDDISFFLHNDPTQIMQGAITPPRWVHNLFLTTRTSLKCANNSSTEGEYYCHTSVSSISTTTLNPVSLTVKFLYDVKLTGFKGDLYYLKYRTNANPNDDSSKIAQVSIEADPKFGSFSGIVGCRYNGDQSNHRHVFRYASQANETYDTLHIYNKNDPSSTTEYNVFDEASTVRNAWTTLILAFTQNRQINCSQWNANYILPGSASPRPCSFPATFNNNSTDSLWYTNYINNYGEGYSNLYAKYTSNFYNVIWEPRSYLSSGWYQGSFQVLSLLTARKFNVEPYHYYVYRLRYNSRTINN